MKADYTVVIRPKKNLFAVEWKELWQYRELFFVLAWRDIKVRYKQTLLGVLWVLFQPLVSMAIFTFFFGRLAKLPSYDLPYPLFVLCGLIFWTFFSNCLSNASAIIIDNENIIKKVYFPKIILPLSTIVTALVDFGINLLLLLVLAVYFGYFPNPSLLLILPLCILLAATTASGLGLFMSALNVKYRDVRYVLPFFVQGLFFLTPIIYPTAIMSDLNKLVLYINPMTAVIELLRSTFSTQVVVHPLHVMISILSAATIFIVGLFSFRNTERFFADIV